MRLVTRIGIAVLVGGWIGWALAGDAIAQGNSTSAERSSRSSDWEQRVVQHQTATTSPNTSQRATSRSPATQDSIRIAAAATQSARSSRAVPSNQPIRAAKPATSSQPIQAAKSAPSSQPIRADHQEVILTAQQTELSPVPLDDSAMMDTDVEFYGDAPVGQWIDDGATCGVEPCCEVGSCGGTVFSEWWAKDLSLFGGAQAFKGPFDQGRNGNFGLHEGLEFGAALGALPGWGYEVGFSAVQSNFSGNETTDEDPGANRDQLFFTAGIFRRALCAGIQWGVAFDLLRDTYYAKADMKQVRAEVGYVYPSGQTELGFWGAFGVGDDEIIVDQQTLLLEPTDQFALYYRRHFEFGGDGRLWGGFTGNGDGLLGADLRVPLGGNWAVENRVNYLIPKEGQSDGASREESWGLSIHLVWYLGQPAACAQRSPYRPLLNVADNGLFMVDTPNE